MQTSNHFKGGKNMKSCIRKMALVLSMMCIIAFASPLSLFAGNLDDLSSDSTTSNGQSNPNVSHGSSDDQSISDYLKDYNPVTQDNMQKAGSMASPIVSALGTFSGFIVMVTSAGIFVITALDLAYIGIPPLRSLLNPQMAGGGQAGGMPMGGMGMGMGMRGGMMGGMGAMGGGAQGAMPEQGLRRKWVSDEAVACVNLANMQNQQGGAAMGGMPMGGMGGMGGMMGGMGGGMQQQAPTPTKSIILEYLKKRMFFIVIFTIATVILMSSLLTDCGLNLAELLSKIIEKFNGQISNVNI